MTATLILVCETIGSQHRFGPNGGAFGRSRKCDWVLPDQDRHLSSVHACILYQNDAFILVDESTNGTFLEGQSAAIGRGKAVSLSPGMKFRAGPYQIRVDSIQSGQATQTNPFAAARPSSGRPAVATPLRIDTSGASLPKNTSLDPLDHLGGGEPETLAPVASVQMQDLIPEPVSFSAPQVPPSPHDTTRFQGSTAPTVQTSAQPATGQAPMMTPAQPTQILPGMPLQPTPQAAPPVQPPAPAAVPLTPAPAAPLSPAAGSGNVIPEDFLAGLGGAPSAAFTGAPSGQTTSLPDHATLMPAAPASAGTPAPATIPDNIDFGLGSPAPISAPVEPPLPGAPVPAAAPPTSSSTPQPVPPAPPAPEAPLNPLDALKKRRAQREAELAQKAKSRTAAPAAAKAPPPAPAGKPAPPLMPGAAAMPAMSPAISAPPVSAPPVSAPPVSSPKPSQPAASPTPAASALPAKPAPARTAAGGEAASEVFQALLSGLGFANADVPEDEQAEIARATGEMVRELANGLISLLNARKSLKTEFRMYETRIQPEENNPFKHFNVGELAIDEMLFARKGGFLPPSEAAREAFKDLQSHTMLTVAATQRAMRLLFESLSPETLAGEEDDGGLRLRGLGSRRGKFEAAKERHDRLRADFDAVVRQTIAEAFVQVEEDQARQQSKTFWENRKK
ncbi:type VI secretion system-associated FHA domain protein [Roseibium sediminicola]|uniref:FHA domain-containing protein n=1 Tax=Roseibium sediminicola TaxID=2933272 RepID=A0ABT0GVN2_9HYPH|nr:type VI secretion system-associated FHA domain protein [Roseibium sp. CAU 1639]MCK7613275.1 FHA domain-containing protein [Roseibium sp. CAU 1639]